MQPTSNIDTPLVYRATNSAGEEIEVCVSREIEIVDQVQYDEPRPCELRFGWEQE